MCIYIPSAPMSNRAETEMGDLGITLLHLEWPKLNRVLAVPRAKGLTGGTLAKILSERPVVRGFEHDGFSKWMDGLMACSAMSFSTVFQS